MPLQRSVASLIEYIYIMLYKQRLRMFTIYCINLFSTLHSQPHKNMSYNILCQINDKICQIIVNFTR